MEKSIAYIEDILSEPLSRSSVRTMNPVVLAWIGDGIFTNAVRKWLVCTKNVHIARLNRLSVGYVKAGAQSKIIHALMDKLTPEERSVVRRGRNTASSVPKNADVSDYRYATGFEALLGYLSLTGQDERLAELTADSIAVISASKGK